MDDRLHARSHGARGTSALRAPSARLHVVHDVLQADASYGSDRRLCVDPDLAREAPGASEDSRSAPSQLVRQETPGPWLARPRKTTGLPPGAGSNRQAEGGDAPLCGRFFKFLDRGARGSISGFEWPVPVYLLPGRATRSRKWSRAHRDRET